MSSNSRSVTGDGVASGNYTSHASDVGTERRNRDDAGYDAWLKQQTDNGWPKWFIQWAFPREQYDGTDEYKGFKNAATAFASLFGLGAGASLISSGGALINLPSITKGSDKQTSSDTNGFGLLNWLFGTGNGNAIGSSIMDVLKGFGSQYASSVMNYTNMEKLIDKQNAYNTPAAQMQRFQDAGLNPNLVYGLGNNGNQPSSGSIAPVDFDTSQREARLARMAIDTQTKMANADVGLKMSQANLADKNAANVELVSQGQKLQNSVFMSTWFTEQWQRLAQIRETINRINNDNKRVDMEKQLNDAEVALKNAQKNSRSAPGAVAYDFVNFMQWFTEQMSKFDAEVPDVLQNPETEYKAPVYTPDSKYKPVVPPHYSGR